MMSEEALKTLVETLVKTLVELRASGAETKDGWTGQRTDEKL